MEREMLRKEESFISSAGLGTGLASLHQKQVLATGRSQNGHRPFSCEGNQSFARGPPLLHGGDGGLMVKPP